MQELIKTGETFSYYPDVKVFQTVAQARTYPFFKDKAYVRTYYHNTDVVSDWQFSSSTPAASVFSLSCVGGWLVLLTPNYASAGLTPGAYVASTAWDNRNLITRLMMDTRFNRFSVGTAATAYILGSIVPNRSFYTTEIESYAYLLGRYDDAAVPASIGKNVGGMFDFVIRGNYHTTGDMTPTGTIESVNLVLNGRLGTEFSAAHSQTHNNNVVGYYQAKNCTISGTGTVTMSDHRGLNFDGNADNCHIRMPDGAVSGTADEPLVMKAAAERYCSTSIGAVHNVSFGGPIAPIVIRCEGGYHDVSIGTFRWDGATKPQLVGAFNCQGIRVKPGRIYGVSQAIRQYQTVDAVLDGGIFSATQSLVNVATPVSTRTRTSISKVKVLDAMESVYYAETNNAIPYSLNVRGCDFSACGTSLQFFKNKTPKNTPKFNFWENNLEPAGMSVPAQGKEWNLLQDIPVSVAFVGATTVAIPLTRNYRFCTVSVSEGGTNRRVTMDLVAAYLSSAGYSFVLSTAASIFATRTGDSLELSLTGCTGQNYVLHN